MTPGQAAYERYRKAFWNPQPEGPFRDWQALSAAVRQEWEEIAHAAIQAAQK